MEISATFQELGIALVLGLLVGLQRESVASRLGGLRTFPLITVLGTLSGLLARSFGPWIPAAGLLCIAILVYSGKQAENRMGVPDPGLTTEVAMLIMFGVGAYLVVGHRAVAIAIGGGTAVLLHFKGQLHDAMEKLSARDLRAIMQFALISMVILPVLPNRTFGPYQVLNPRNIWLMVVLIVGIGLSGYIAYKFAGERTGLLLSGVLGGLISSTATTVSFSRRTAADPNSSRPASIVIVIASSLVFIRLMIEIGSVSSSLLRAAALPLALMMAVLAASAWATSLFDHGEIERLPAQENPSELRSAVLFAALYSGVLLATAFAKENFGSGGLFAVAGISGLTDVDAITLSTAQMVNLDRIASSTGWKAVVIAAMSNLVFKSITVAVLGNRNLSLRTILCFGLSFLTGAALLALRP